MALKTTTYRIKMTYQAHGMRRPLHHQQDVSAVSVREAVRQATEWIQSAYIGGFQRLTWSAENLDKPAPLKYVYRGNGPIAPR